MEISQCGTVARRRSERPRPLSQFAPPPWLVCLFPDLDDPMVTVHQSIGEAKEQFYYERTVFLRCVANSNPPVRYSWHRGREVLTQGSDKGVEIYEPFFTQVSQRQRGPGREKKKIRKFF